MCASSSSCCFSSGKTVFRRRNAFAWKRAVGQESICCAAVGRLCWCTVYTIPSMDTYEGLVRKECAYIMPISCEAKVQRPGGDNPAREWGVGVPAPLRESFYQGCVGSPAWQHQLKNKKCRKEREEGKGHRDQVAKTDLKRLKPSNQCASSQFGFKDNTAPILQ